MSCDVMDNGTEGGRDSLNIPVVTRVALAEDWELTALAHQFQRDGFLKVGHLLTPEVKRIVRDDVLRLIERFSERNELKLETTGGTPRRMSTVRSERIAEDGREVPLVYKTAELVDILERIAGEKLAP